MTTQEVDYTVSGSAVGRQGHSYCCGCCGCCEDSRRAVIIVNIISVCFASPEILALGGFMALLTVALGSFMDMGVLSQSPDDDEVRADFFLIGTANAFIGLMIALSAIKIVCHGVGIYGAMTYNIWMVGVSLAVYCLNFAMGIVTSGSINIVGVLMFGCSAYPHLVFIQEVRRNYVNEKQS
jgi:hypothetical protein